MQHHDDVGLIYSLIGKTVTTSEIDEIDIGVNPPNQSGLSDMRCARRLKSALPCRRTALSEAVAGGMAVTALPQFHVVTTKLASLQRSVLWREAGFIYQGDSSCSLCAFSKLESCNEICKQLV